jgi:hypothetical protein
MKKAKQMRRRLWPCLCAGLLAVQLASPAAAQDAPAAFGVADRATILVVHGVGAQIYECKPDPGGANQWVFREPVASLFKDGQTVGRHYAGPTWALEGDATLKGKSVASAPGATTADVPLLKLEVVQRQGDGALKDAALVLRLNTHGGVLKGPCERAGGLHAEPYSADYVFLR